MATEANEAIVLVLCPHKAQGTHRGMTDDRGKMNMVNHKTNSPSEESTDDTFRDCN